MFIDISDIETALRGVSDILGCLSSGVDETPLSGEAVYMLSVMIDTIHADLKKITAEDDGIKTWTFSKEPFNG